MSEDFGNTLDRLIRARCSLLYVVTFEEQRARRLLARVAGERELPLYEWSITDGLRAVVRTSDNESDAKRIREPLAVLNAILQRGGKGLFVLKDFHEHLDAPEIVRYLRDLAHALRSTHKTIILLSPILKLPEELEKEVTILDLPLPDRRDLRNLLRGIVKAHQSGSFKVNLSDDDCNALARAAQGLTLLEAENAFARAIVVDGKLDGADVQAVIEEKKQVVRKSGVLEYYDPRENLRQVGGMSLLKEWIRKRGKAFSEAARRYGLPEPRGMMLMGVQGCGKSLFAKSVASQWRLPLLRMDMSRIFEGYIGSSEKNMRKALTVAESLAPAVLWIDEIEKAFSGAGDSTSADSGTTARVVGTFLTWMQEKAKPVFVVATANDVSGLPPELLRKGRFDEIFFIDLPDADERKEIFSIHMKKLKRDPANFDMDALAHASAGFSGAEIEQALIEALHDSFFEDREVATADIVHCLGATVPLSRTMGERIEALRLWARDRARPVVARPIVESPIAAEEEAAGDGGA